jgi:hypothetical protein
MRHELSIINDLGADKERDISQESSLLDSELVQDYKKKHDKIESESLSSL